MYVLPTPKQITLKVKSISQLERNSNAINTLHQSVAVALSTFWISFQITDKKVSFLLKIKVFLRENIIHSFCNNYWVVSANKHSSKTWWTENSKLRLSKIEKHKFSLSLSSFEFYVHQSNEKSVCLHQYHSDYC